MLCLFPFVSLSVSTWLESMNRAIAMGEGMRICILVVALIVAILTVTPPLT